MPAKRRSSPLDREDKSPKRRETVPVNVNDDDDLEEILAQIKQQEESEALARKLHEEWNNPVNAGGSGNHGGHYAPLAVEHEYDYHSEEEDDFGFAMDMDIDMDMNVDDEDDEDDDDHGDSDSSEGDEALARRLAAEWAKEDGTPAKKSVPGLLASLPETSHGQSRPVSKSKGKLPRSPDTPDSKLEVYHEFFVGSRNCTECGHEILSPRGYVCNIVHIFGTQS